MKKTLLLIGIAASFSVSSQSLVDTTQAENKNVLLEEYTGRNCGFCPDGHRIANEVKEDNPSDVILMRIHTGGYAPTSYPNFNTSFGPLLAGQSGITGFPTGTINRHIFSGSSTSMSRSLWPSKANEVLAEQAIVNIGMNAVIDSANRKLSVEVELYYTGSQTENFNRLNVVILQDNIAGHQGGSSFNPDDVLSNGEYNHKHILRDMPLGTWGVKIDTISEGTFVRKVVSYDIPENLNGIDIKLEDLDIAVFVIEDRQEVLNAVHARPKMGSALSIEAFSVSPLEVYPNPAENKLNVEFEVRQSTLVSIKLYNLLGQSVIELEKTFSAGNRKIQLNVEDLETGIYLLELSNGNSSSSHKVIIK